MTGDGTGVLYNAITSTYRKYNTWSSAIKEGWIASQLRAVLNGSDEYTSSYAADVSADESIFSCFPDELQSAIVEKVVLSEDDTGLTYDKLWLLSLGEINASSAVAGLNQYARFRAFAADWDNISMDISSVAFGYDETGSARTWWLRALSDVSGYWSGMSGYALAIGESDWGNISCGRYSNTFAIAPCFCLE